MVRLERHPLGPRVYLCGLRIREFALEFTDVWKLTRRTEPATVFGTWRVDKDWRDLFPSERNTASWGLLSHRVPRD